MKRVDKMDPRITQMCSLELQQEEQPPWAAPERCTQQVAGHSAVSIRRLKLSMGHDACLTKAEFWLDISSHVNASGCARKAAWMVCQESCSDLTSDLLEEERCDLHVDSASQARKRSRCHVVL